MKYCFILMTTLLLSFQVFSDDAIGRITKLRGKVYKTNKSKDLEPQRLYEGSKIHVGDSIHSESASFAKVLMLDDTIFSIGPKTEFAFEKFKIKNVNDNDRDATYYLVKGKLRSLFTRKAPRRSLKIKTPVASMAVRGTEIVSDVYKYKGKVRADIGLLSGSLEVYSQGKMTKLQPQDIFEVARDNIKGRRPANSFKQRKMSQEIFRSLKKSRSKGGESFLFDALKKSRKALSKGASFSFDVEAKGKKSNLKLQELKKVERGFVKSKSKKERGRLPASVGPSKEDKRKKERVTTDRIDVVKEAGIDKFRREEKPMFKPRNRIKRNRVRRPCPAGTIRIGGICRRQELIEPKLEPVKEPVSSPTNVLQETSTQIK